MVTKTPKAKTVDKSKSVKPAWKIALRKKRKSNKTQKKKMIKEISSGAHHNYTEALKRIKKKVEEGKTLTKAEQDINQAYKAEEKDKKKREEDKKKQAEKKKRQVVMKKLRATRVGKFVRRRLKKLRQTKKRNLQKQKLEEKKKKLEKKEAGLTKNRKTRRKRKDIHDEIEKIENEIEELNTQQITGGKDALTRLIQSLKFLTKTKQRKGGPPIQKINKYIVHFLIESPQLGRKTEVYKTTMSLSTKTSTPVVASPLSSTLYPTIPRNENIGSPYASRLTKKNKEWVRIEQELEKKMNNIFKSGNVLHIPNPMYPNDKRKQYIFTIQSMDWPAFSFPDKYHKYKTFFRNSPFKFIIVCTDKAGKECKNPTSPLANPQKYQLSVFREIQPQKELVIVTLVHLTGTILTPEEEKKKEEAEKKLNDTLTKKWKAEGKSEQQIHALLKVEKEKRAMGRKTIFTKGMKTLKCREHLWEIQKILRESGLFPRPAETNYEKAQERREREEKTRKQIQRKAIATSTTARVPTGTIIGAPSVLAPGYDWRKSQAKTGKLGWQPARHTAVMPKPKTALAAAPPQYDKTPTTMAFGTSPVPKHQPAARPHGHIGGKRSSQRRTRRYLRRQKTRKRKKRRKGTKRRKRYRL